MQQQDTVKAISGGGYAIYRNRLLSQREDREAILAFSSVTAVDWMCSCQIHNLKITMRQ